jgi:hypothetical protein
MKINVKSEFTLVIMIKLETENIMFNALFYEDNR